MRGRVGGRVGSRDATQPKQSAANGLWGILEAFDALLRNSWPRSRVAGVRIDSPQDQNGSCEFAATFTANAYRSSGWGDPSRVLWETSSRNADLPPTGNIWLAEHFKQDDTQPNINPLQLYATGLASAPMVAVEYTSPSTTSDPLQSSVVLLANFDNGAFDHSPRRMTAFLQSGASLTTQRKLYGTRSLSGGSVSFQGDSRLSGNYTIEGWFWLNETTTSRPLVSLGTSTEGSGYVAWRIKDGFIEYHRHGETAVVYDSIVVPNQDWNHLAFVRVGQTMTVFLNGVVLGSTSQAGTIGDLTMPRNLQIHCRSGDFVNEFRITSAARYTSSFVPPQAAFPVSGSRPIVVVSGAADNQSNGNYEPKATGTREYDAKQFFYKDGRCVHWDESTGYWSISTGTEAGPEYWGGVLYTSDGSVWTPVETGPQSYANPKSSEYDAEDLTFADNGRMFRARNVSGFYDIASRPAKVTVEPVIILFTQQPADQFAVAGSATFSVQVSGTGQSTGNSYANFEYQWQKRSAGSTGEFEDIVGFTNATATASGLSTGDNGEEYRVRVTSTCGDVNIAYSRIATLYVGTPNRPTQVYGIPGDSQVTLYWTAPTSTGLGGITGYVIQHSSDRGANWTTLPSTGSTLTTFVVTGLTNDTPYLFRVRGVNSVGVGPFSDPSAYVTPAVPGTDPFFQDVVYVSNYEGPNNSTTFRDWSLAERPVVRTGDAKISTAQSKWGSAAYFDGTGDFLTISDPNAFKFGSADFTLEAWIFPLTGESWQEKAIITTADPIDQTGFYLGMTDRGRWLLGNTVWQANNFGSQTISTNEWHFISLSRSRGVARLYVDGQLVNSSSNATNLTNFNNLLRIGGRTVGNQYFQGYLGGVRVTKGADRYPAGITYTVPTAPFPVATTTATPPAPPSVVMTTSGNGQIQLSWEKPANNGSIITDYVIEYSDDYDPILEEGTWQVVQDGIGTTRELTVTGLAAGVTYYFRFASVNTIGTGAYSNIFEENTNFPPDPPVELVASAGNTEASLTWSAPADNGGSPITGYIVETTPAGGSPTPTSTGNVATAATITGLVNGTSYSFRVAAISDAGTGQYSDAVNGITPVAGVPGSPTAVSAIKGDSQVSLSWASPSNDGGSPITEYVIEYTAGSSSPVLLQTGNAANARTITGLANGVSHTFRVAAVNSSGTSVFSSPSQPVVPSAFAPTAVILTTGSSYTVPQGAVSMKAWVVGHGTYNAGAVAFKTWPATGGTTVNYSLGGTTHKGSSNLPTTLVYDGTTISASTGDNNTTFSGGDGGVAGGYSDYSGDLWKGGAVGGNSAGSQSPCNRIAATDVSGLLAAVALAGGKAVEDCGTSAAFGSGASYDQFQSTNFSAGIGGGDAQNPANAGSSAVVLYFVGGELPDEPTGLTAEATGINGQIALNWTRPVDSGNQAITSYVVEYSDDEGANWTVA